MIYNYSFKNYISIWGKIIVSYLAIIFIFALTTNLDSDPIWSYSTLIFSSLIGLRLFYGFFLGDIGFSGYWIIAGAFLFKLILSTVHFITFIQPDYFNGITIYNFNLEFYWMHDSIQYLAERAKEFGFSNALTFDYFVVNKGAVIFYLYSPFYYIGGDLVLNLCHVNTIFTLFTAILLTYMAKNFFDLNKKQLFMTLILSSFFPFGLITSITIRDFAGQFLIALGMISLQYAFKNSKLFGLLFVSGILFFFQRKIYIILPFAAYLIQLFFNAKDSDLKILSRKFNIRVLILIVSMVIGLYYYKLATQSEIIDAESQLSSEYTSDISKAQFYLLLPIYIFKGFLGPFPWTQFFKYQETTIYQLGDYLTSTFIFASLITLWRNKNLTKSFKDDVNIVSICSILMSFVGIASGYMHISYVAISLIFLIPFVSKHSDLNFFMRNYIFVFYILLLLSLLWDVFGFYGAGGWQYFKS
jgi:hypothetical protein